MLFINNLSKSSFKYGTVNSTARRKRSLIVGSRLIGLVVATVGLCVTIILYVTSFFFPSGPSARFIEHNIGPIPDFNSTVPIPCHSHNDYWRNKPLYSALIAGCMGVEADIWPFRDSLYVGHGLRDLNPGKTLQSMYIEPLEKILDERNKDHSSGPPRGVYAQDPEATLILLIDVKRLPRTAWRLMLEDLEPLRQKGWLSRVVDGKFVSGPITVVGTGDSTLEMIESNHFSDTFLDAPLDTLDEGNYSHLNSYYASVSFKKSIGRYRRGGLEPSQLHELRRQVASAHKRGLKVRYWGMPDRSVETRDALWDIFMDEGVDFLNADDLTAARDLFIEQGIVPS